MIANGVARRAGVGVVLCLGLAMLSACSGSQPEGLAPSSPPASVEATPPADAGPTIDGTAFYLGSTIDGSLVVHAVRDSEDTAYSIATDDGPCPYNSAILSPAGDQIAWVADDADGNGAGTLMISDLSGSNRRTVPGTVICLGSTPLVWLEPGKIQVISASDGRRLLLDPVTGKVLGQGEDVVWSADGAWLATEDRSGPIVMPKGNPGAARRYTYEPPAGEAQNWDGWSVRSVSVDGRYVSVGWNGTDPSRHLDSFAIVDTVTSTAVALPVTGSISAVHFLADSTVLVRLGGGRLVLLDRQFTVLGETTEPASVRDWGLLKYLPAGT